MHENGTDDVEGQNIIAINAYVTSNDIGFPTGGVADEPVGLNRWTRLVRIEPDFVQSGDMTVEIIGKEFANSVPTTDGPYIFTSGTEKIDMRVQRRNLSLKFRSSVYGGNFEMGKVLLHLEPGDVRS
jgi:hypothetical protein